METFKNYLQQEYLRRLSRNTSYSLRAYAQFLGINHATLSTLLSGKRKITKSTVVNLSKVLGLGPEEVKAFLGDNSETATVEEKAFYLLQNDVFSLISEWYFDAILEMSLFPKVNLEASSIATLLDIPMLQATLALETLERVGLLKKNENGRYVITHKNSTNILDRDLTTIAQRNYQKAVLEKSIESLESIDRKKRDHTSTTMAINSTDLPKAKELIQKFRHDLNAYLQRDEEGLDEIYQLTVSFFPLTNKDQHRSPYEN
jgi:plasmid maintenance system antidote protein VapI/DNA-binding transcriptional regulator YhcF (GntR family)